MILFLIVISQIVLSTKIQENMIYPLRTNEQRSKNSVNVEKNIIEMSEACLKSRQMYASCNGNFTIRQQGDPEEGQKSTGLHLRRSTQNHIASSNSLQPSKTAQAKISELNCITFKESDCYLHNPALHLYDKFNLQFSFQTSQEYGLLLFNSNKQGVDFLAFELIGSYLHFSFDMGSGIQRYALTTHAVTDSKWHHVELTRTDLENNTLYLYVDQKRSTEQFMKIPVVNGENVKISIPNDVLNCNKIGRDHKHETEHEYQSTKLQHLRPYCLNDGICLQSWKSVKCACELTTFEGDRCTRAGTTFQFGNNQNMQAATHLFDEKKAINNRVRNTRQDEFILGIQTFSSEVDKEEQHDRLTSISTLLFITSLNQVGDFVHLFLESGILRLNYDMGGGLVHISGPNFPINDGFYHRIRGYRVDYQIILEVDNTRHTYELNRAYGRRFNNQKVIWIGHSPKLNKTNGFRGYMTGVYYNGLLLNDLAAGLSYLSFIHVSRFGSVEYVPKFQPHMTKSSSVENSVSKKSNNSDVFSTKNVPADSAMNYVDQNEDSSFIATETFQKKSIVMPPVTDSSTEYLSTLEYHTYNNSFRGTYESPDMPYLNVSHLDKNNWKFYKKISAIYGQVNVWLLFSLAGAGIVMVTSLTFLAYRCHRNRYISSQCFQPKQIKLNQQYFNYPLQSLITKNRNSVGSLLSMDEIRYTVKSINSTEYQEPISSFKSDIISQSLYSHLPNISEKHLIPSNINTSFLFVSEPINLPISSLAITSDGCVIHKNFLSPTHNCEVNMNETILENEKHLEIPLSDSELILSQSNDLTNTLNDCYIKANVMHLSDDICNTDQLNIISELQHS
ncbi:unnamed protein product [Heterobilharzia americana]|nr:unnamed protein product [Heterobilharzia americana]